MIKIGLLHTGIRLDEKLLMDAAKSKKVSLDLIDVRKLILDPENLNLDYDVYLERCISTVKGTHITRFLEEMGQKVVNNLETSLICEDKFATTLRLMRRNVPAIKAVLCFTEEEAKEAVNRLGGYPIVIKPTSGSWGRLISKIGDETSLESVLEHKQTLGGPDHGAFYIQEYVEKSGRDIRAFVIDGECICAIYRHSDHWITNTARGGKASKMEVTADLRKISKQAADAVGGGILALDIFETETGFKINEINHTMEFKNSETPTGVSISGAIIDYCIKIAKL